MIFSINYPNRTVTFHHENCDIINRAMIKNKPYLKECGCGKIPSKSVPNKYNQMYLCNDHFNVADLAEFFNGRTWSYNDCSHCAGTRD